MNGCLRCVRRHMQLSRADGPWPRRLNSRVGDLVHGPRQQRHVAAYGHITEYGPPTDQPCLTLAPGATMTVPGSTVVAGPYVANWA